MLLLLLLAIFEEFFLQAVLLFFKVVEHELGLLEEEGFFDADGFYVLVSFFDGLGYGFGGVFVVLDCLQDDVIEQGFLVEFVEEPGSLHDCALKD